MMVFNKRLTLGLYIITIVLVNGISSQLPSGSACTLLDGSPGICKPALTCEWLKNEIRSNRISIRDVQGMRCSFENNVEITCCKSVTLIRKSQQECESYRLVRTPVLTFHVLNGTLAALGEFPHMAALGYLSEENNQDIEFRCGGSLISDRYILTAGHCYTKPTIARLGTVNIKTPEANPEKYGAVLDVDVESIIQHPDYIIFRNLHDIALVRLAQVVRFSANLHPACLNADLSDHLSSPELYITGWGRVSATNDEKSPFLLKANITSVNLNDCNRSLTPFFGRKLPNGLNSGHFCARDPNGWADTCKGDSGGPIQIIDTIRDMPIIVGVTSFGVDCGSTLPSVYARVAFYLDWIESIVWPN